MKYRNHSQHPYKDNSWQEDCKQRVSLFDLLCEWLSLSKIQEESFYILNVDHLLLIVHLQFYQLALQVFPIHQFMVHFQHHNLLEHMVQTILQPPIKEVQLKIQQKLQ